MEVKILSIFSKYVRDDFSTKKICFNFSVKNREIALVYNIFYHITRPAGFLYYNMQTNYW